MVFTGSLTSSGPRHTSWLYRASQRQTTKPLFSLCSSFRLSLFPAFLPTAMQFLIFSRRLQQDFHIASLLFARELCCRSKRVVVPVVSVFSSYLFNDLFIFSFSFACSCFSLILSPSLSLYISGHVTRVCITSH